MTLLSDDTISDMPAYSNHGRWDCDFSELGEYVLNKLHRYYSLDKLIRGQDVSMSVKCRVEDWDISPSSAICFSLYAGDTDVHLYNALGDYKLDLPKEAIERVQAGESSEAVLTPEQRETLYNFFASCLLYEIFEADNEERPVSFSYGEVVGQEKVVFVMHEFNEHFKWYPDGCNLAEFYTEESTGLSEDCEASDALNALFAQVERYDRISLFGKVLNVLGIRIEVGDDTLYGWYEGDDLDTKAAALTERLIEEHKEEFPEEYESEEDDYDDEYDDEYDEDEYADEDEVSEEVDASKVDAVSESTKVKS